MTIQLIPIIWYLMIYYDKFKEVDTQIQLLIFNYLFSYLMKWE